MSVLDGEGRSLSCVTRQVTPPPPAGSDRRDELARLRALLRRVERHAAAPRRSPPSRTLPLEPIETPYGVAWRRTETVALDPGVATGLAMLPPPGTVYLDTETTGLAGGTGTYVFLVGLAEWQGGRLQVTQYFLDDLGAEGAFLSAVTDALATTRRLVTFNGRTFDLPLLETRYLLARRVWWGECLEHLDLYPLARALWRARVEDCRLTTLERSLLGLDRGDDLPGALMPQLYFRWLRARDPAPVPRILAHNRWDLVALAALAGRAEALLAGPHGSHHPEEWLGAARWLERRDPVRSAGFYEAALGGALGPDARARAAWRLGVLWRRAGGAGRTLRLWTDVVAGVEAPPIGLLVDLAKLQEHVARDLATALAVTRAALVRAEADGLADWRPDVAEALRQRARRLERRLRRTVATADGA